MRNAVSVNITLPVYNEEKQITKTVECLRRFLFDHCRFSFEIVIANNGSTDNTLKKATELSKKYKDVFVLHLCNKGRGLALKTAWNQSECDVLSYMDIDLSTDLAMFPSLIKAIVFENFDLAVGSRLLKSSLVKRSLLRESISRIYNMLLKQIFFIQFSDAQCGFKAIRKHSADILLPQIKDNDWFFDTELLVIAELLKFEVFDLPVNWIEDTDSRVKIFKTAYEDLKGIVRLRRSINQNSYNKTIRRIKLTN